MAVRTFLQLNNGLVMPSVGLGTYLAVGDQLRQAVDYALHVGYRHIDTAVRYGNESDLGSAISEQITKGKVQRKDLFITTKIPPVYFASHDMRSCVESSLDRLMMPYVDMLLLHSPHGKRNHGDGEMKPLNDKGEIDHYHYNLLRVWESMEAFVDQGRAKSIGLSNFSPSQISRIWDNARIKPANLQMECHIYLQQNVLRDFCAKKGIAVTAYSPLGAPGRPDRHRHTGDNVALTDPAIIKIAKNHKKTPGQILLRYLLQLGAAPLPKSDNHSRIKENISVFDFSLSSGDMNVIRSLDRNQKYYKFLDDQNHPEYSKTEPF